MNSNEKLDAVLEYLKQKHDERIIIESYSNDIGQSWTQVSSSEFDKHWASELILSIEVFGDKIEPKEVSLILDYLEKDNLITSRYPNQGMLKREYSILFYGKRFIENGGYVEQHNRDQIKYKLDIQQSQLNSLELYLKRKTFWIASAGLVLSIILAIREFTK